MKKSTYIDFAVIMAARSHKSKMKNKPAKDRSMLIVSGKEEFENYQLSKALATAMVLEIFSRGLTA